MALNRRVVGSGSAFKVSRRATAGKNQVVAPQVDATDRAPVAPVRPNLPIPQGVPAAVAPAFQPRYQADPISGWQKLMNDAAASGDPLQSWIGGLFGGSDAGAGMDTSIIPSGPSVPPPNYLTGGEIAVNRLADAANDANRDPSTPNYINLFGTGIGRDGNRQAPSQSAPYLLKQSEYSGGGVTSNDRSADDRLRARVMGQVRDNYTPSRDEIIGYTQTAINDFNTERARLEALRDGALADGLEEVADQYDAQLRSEQRAIEKLQDEIALTGDIESWYRNRIKGPYEEAKAAAEAVDLEATMAVQSKYRNEQATELAAVEERLEGVLGSLGFTPDQITAMRADRAADNEVTAAQNQLLEASGVRRGELDWEKKLRYSMAEEELQRSNRESSGRELIVASRNREAIADAETRIGELNNLKDKAMARVRRAVDREFQGAQFPEKDEFISAAIASMEQDLIGDLSPNEQDWFRSVVGEFYADGKDFSTRSLKDMILSDRIYVAGANEALAGIEDKWKAIAREQDLPFSTVQGEAFTEMSSWLDQNFDQIFDGEDIGILKGMVSTYKTAEEEYARYVDQRADRNYSNAENTHAQNIADAKAGVGVYGERARTVASMVPVIQQIFGGMVTSIQGANYFRPYEENPPPGRAKNSDHLTAGALDLMMPRDSAEHRRYYNEVMVPQLRRWQEQGLVASWLGYEQNSAHDDHVHVSFALGANANQGFNPQTVPQHNDHTNHDHRDHVDQPTSIFYGRGGI